MLQAFIPDATPLDCDDYYIRELPSGLDELIFNISIWTDLYRQITEETLIEDREGDKVARYRVKAIDGGDNTAQVKAVLDLDDWKKTVVFGYARSGTIAQNVSALLPSGWSMVDRSGMARTADVEVSGGTPLDILQECRKSFDGASFRFDQTAKTVTIWDLYNGLNLGTFMTRELNLHDVQYKGKSSAFVTRLYAYGKDGLSIADANGGVPYVDNFTYSDRIVCGFWQDTRYEIASNLKEAAIARLAELAVPERSYNCSVADLAAIDPERYSYLSFELFNQVGLIDETRSDTKIMHRVVERWRYPNYPEKNNIILSNSPRRLQVQVIEALRGPINGNRIELGSIGSGKIGTDAVLTGNLSAGAVTTPKLADSAVTTGKINESAVTVNKIDNGAVTSVKIQDGAVIENKILNQAVSYAKLSEQLQVFYADTIAATALFSQFLKADGSVTASVVSASNYISVQGIIYQPKTYTIYDTRNTYSVNNNVHSVAKSVFDGNAEIIGTVADTYYLASLSSGSATNTIYNLNVLGKTEAN